MCTASSSGIPNKRTWTCLEEGHEEDQRLEHLSYEDKLRKLVFCNLEKRRFWGGLGAAFQYPKGACKKLRRLCTRECSDKRDNAVTIAL